MDTTIRIGVSSCLLGNPVRYDGGHQLDPFITGTLGHFFEFVPVCPEAECGLGVPRETMRLVGDAKRPRLVTTETGIDRTDVLLSWAQRKLKELEDQQLDGFIFKSKSPSCGMARVKVYPPAGGEAKRVGGGLFARSFMEYFPLLPVEDEGRLHDLAPRENFIERVFICRRWRAATQGAMTASALLGFHGSHKLQLMAHSERHCRAMGRLMAKNGAESINALFAEYGALLLEALRLPATVAKHCNVLRHILGYFKKELAAPEKREILELIDQYRDGLIPLLAPVTLFNHYLRKFPQEYLAGQYYLHPQPLELKLRHHA